MRKKINYALLVVFLSPFSVAGEGINENKQKVQLDEKVSLNLVCTPKRSDRDPIVLSSFSIESVYNYDEVRIWYASVALEFIPTEIKVDKNGIEIMKGKRIDSRGRRTYVQFKDNSHPPIYDIYALKHEWNCIANKK